MNSSTFLSVLCLSIPPQDEWRLHEPLKEEAGGPEKHEGELTQLFPEVWAKDKPLSPTSGWLDIKPQ